MPMLSSSVSFFTCLQHISLCSVLLRHAGHSSISVLEDYRYYFMYSALLQLLPVAPRIYTSTQPPFLTLWPTAHKDLQDHSWTGCGNANHLMPKIHLWCSSAVQSIITKFGLTCSNSFGRETEQQSQLKQHFLYKMLTAAFSGPWTKCFPFWFWW